MVVDGNEHDVLSWFHCGVIVDSNKHDVLSRFHCGLVAYTIAVNMTSYCGFTMVRYMTEANMLRWFRCDLELGCSKHVTGNECLTHFIIACFQIDQAANKRVQRFPWQPEIYWSEQIRPQGWRWFGTKIKIWFYSLQFGYLYQFPYLNLVINHLIWPSGWTSRSIFSTRQTRADLFSLDSKLWKM